MTGRLVAAVLFLLWPAWAAAHGDAHDAAKAIGAGAPVRVQDYWMELLTHPGPLALGQPGHVLVKLSRHPSLAPVSGARVLIAIEPVGGGARPGGSDVAGDPRVTGHAHGADAHAHGAVAAGPLDPGHGASHVSGGTGDDGHVDLAPAAEVTWAGQYEAAVTPRRLGAHRVQVVVAQAEGRRLASPLVVEFPVFVEPVPGLGLGTWAMLSLVAGIGGIGIYGMRVRARLPGSTEPLNLLDIGWVRRLLTATGVQLAIQLPMLLLMALVVFLGLRDVQDSGTNLASRLTWTIWWAGIIFTFVLFGRVWCVACPFGALNEWASRLVAPARKLPGPLRNLWWATGLFVLLTWADEQLGLVRSPRVTAWIVILFAALAVAVGLLYERRSFCRYLCPIGGVIGLYAMTAPLELRVRDTGVCGAHREKTCYRGGNGSRGCPMFCFPQTMDRNTYCTLCGECVKGCGRDNMVLRFRAFGRDLWASGRRALDESYLAIALVGLTFIVTAQMLSGWSGVTSALADALPAWIRASMKPVTYLGLVESAVLLGGALVAAPLLLTAAAALVNRSAGEDALGLRRTFVLFGYMFVPIGLAMHLAHNLSHLLVEGPGILPAAQRAIALYTPLSLGEPEWPAPPLATGAVVAVFQMAVMLGFFVLSLVAGRRLAVRAYARPEIAARAFVPMAALSLLFTLAGIVLLTQPMAMRHGP